MTYKQIEQARETRMWIKDILVPVAIAGAVIFRKPETRQKVKNKFEGAVTKVKEKFNKK